MEGSAQLARLSSLVSGLKDQYFFGAQRSKIIATFYLFIHKGDFRPSRGRGAEKLFWGKPSDPIFLPLLLHI